MSRTMKEIVEQLKPLCAKVSAILNLQFLAANCCAPEFKATSRSITTSESIEPQLYGRKDETSNIVQDITTGEYRDIDLTVLPIVGPGGIGKTTLTQYIYNDEELNNHFEAKLWVCVSINFNVHRLTQEIANKLPNDKKDSPDKQIEEQLKFKRFLLVLDDMWDLSNEDEWKRFLVPLKKGQTKGNVILVTTRFPALAQIVKTTNHWKDLKGLDPESFKELFRAYAFGDKQSMKDHDGLLYTGDKIVEKLKGSPLAAKTVGRLLRNNLDLGHWTRVLESKEWESQNEEHDIMPALKLSFDYLPFHLQQCFTYCALFPEDYKFGTKELIHFWIGLDVLHSRGENKTIEDIGLRYLVELVNYGFFKKEEDEHGHTYYIIHDLLHELAMKVSTDECLSICSSNNVRSLQTPPSIRHLSVNIDESSVKDRKTFDICKEDFSALGERLKVENLHSLMLFGKHQGSFVKTFYSLFHKAKALRVIFISGGKYRVEDLFHNFLNLVHLRYLRIHNDWWEKSEPPKNISRFYHLRVLDLQGCDDCFGLAGYMRNLVKLRHCLVLDHRMHSSISEVGRLKSLQELRRFEVGKESHGFELRQLGHLLELCGSLSIHNLENVEGREEAYEAKLMHKKHLYELILNWGDKRSTKDPAHEEQILEGLKPHSNLRKISISGHAGATCPSWLGVSLSVKNLESLCLDGVAWNTFPPIGELLLINECGEEHFSNIRGQEFQNLKRIELVELAGLKKWVVDSTGQLFAHLEVLIIRHCYELLELTFSNVTCSQQEGEQMWFPKLRELKIDNCPKLSSLPPVPWTSAPCPVDISGVGLAFESLRYTEDYESALSLEITGKDGEVSATFWTALDFNNLTEVKKLDMSKCPALPLDALQMMSSLKALSISDCNNAFGPVEDGSHVRCEFPVLERMEIRSLGASGTELTQVLSWMPKLSQFVIDNCKKITGLGVVEHQKEEATSSSSEEEQIDYDGLLLLPPQLQELQIWSCPELSLRHGENGGGLQTLSSLRSLWICGCPKFLACYLPSSSSCFPFPTSLDFLSLEGVETLAPLSNLASLTTLWIEECRDSGGAVGLVRLLAHGCLHELIVERSPNIFSIGSEDTPEMLQQGLSFPSSKLSSLSTDDVAGVLVAPICTLLSSSLTSLFLEAKEMERFTKEQDDALELLTSLQQLTLLGFHKLQCLPAGLQKLTNLKTLKISSCNAIRSLPKGGLPCSLQKLRISSCEAIRSLPKDGLPNSLQKLKISNCPSLQALPKGGLPSSLQLLDVQDGNSEELRRQCRKLIGTIPIVRT